MRERVLSNDSPSASTEGDSQPPIQSDFSRIASRAPESHLLCRAYHF